MTGNFLEITDGITTNKQNMIPLSEARVMNLINRHSDSGYIIISPCRSENTPEENNAAMRSIVKDIKQSVYSYTPVYGGFIENKGTEDEQEVFEKSFIVYNRSVGGNILDIKDLYNFGLALARKYNQESFLFKAPNDKAKYIKQDGSVDMEFNGTSFNDFSNEYFTALHRKSNKSGRFSLTECYINPKQSTYFEGHSRWYNGEVFLRN